MIAVVFVLVTLFPLWIPNCAAETQFLSTLRPSKLKRDSLVMPNIPVKMDLPRAMISRRNGHTNAVSVRETTGIQSLVYTPLSYNVLLSVGNIPFEAALDTGSSDFWIISDACHTSQCRGTPTFPLNKFYSPSFASVNGNQTVFNVSFADGTAASGFVAREAVRIGDLESMGLVSSSNLTLGPSTSGVLGLGFSRLSRIASSLPNAPPFLDALAQLGELAYPLFGLSFTHGSGTLSMGAVDASVVSNVSQISWHQVVPFAPSPGENATSTPLYLNWALPLTNLTVNGTSITLHPTYSSATAHFPLALLDAGNNGIYGPYQDVAAIFRAMGTIRQVNEGSWAIPCDSATIMAFSFEATTIFLQPSDYLIGPTLGDPNLCLSWPMALPPSADGLDWHFGTPFLRKAYSIYSYGIDGREPPLIGLYPLSNSTSLTDTPASLSSDFSSLSATISTTVPAVLLPTPSYTTPSYLFNTSITPTLTAGQITPTQTDLGASSYSALFGHNVFLNNATALSKVAAPQLLVTLIITDTSGIHTTISTASSIPTALLGKPQGSTNRARRLQWDQDTWRLVWMILCATGWTWAIV